MPRYFILGTVAKLWLILKRLTFKQCLIYTRSSVKKDGFSNKLYFLHQIKQDFFKDLILSKNSQIFK